MQWSQDSRCTVAYGTLWTRVRQGMPLEEAILSGLCRRGNLYDGFGEQKTLSEWAADPRCRTTQTALKQRLKRGEALETALTRPVDPKRPQAGHAPTTWTGFGETKTLLQWFNDPRCTISRRALRARLNAGVPIEEALVAHPFQLVSKKVSAFGERKVAEEWSKDPRCKVSLLTLLRRLRMNLDPELALTNPYVGSGNSNFEAFGETKTLIEWYADDRCVASFGTLQSRLNKDLSLEPAMTKADPKRPPTYEGFGERKTLKQWSRDPRCVVSYKLLSARLVGGKPLEEALTASPPTRNPRRSESKTFTAFGECKTLREWGLDSRSVVKHKQLSLRIWLGWSLERALLTPERTSWEYDISAFGETKSVRQWADDPRCQVSFSTLKTRIGRGEELEDAMRPPDNQAFRRFWDLNRRGLGEGSTAESETQPADASKTGNPSREGGPSSPNPKAASPRHRPTSTPPVASRASKKI